MRAEQQAREPWPEVEVRLLAERDVLVVDGIIPITEALKKTLRWCSNCKHRRRHPWDEALPVEDRSRLACSMPGGSFHGSDEEGVPYVCGPEPGCAMHSEAPKPTAAEKAARDYRKSRGGNQ